jgi:hypothetical protein
MQQNSIKRSTLAVEESAPTQLREKTGCRNIE